MFNWFALTLIYGFMMGMIYGIYADYYEKEKAMFGRVPWWFPLLGFFVVILWPVGLFCIAMWAFWVTRHARG